MGGKKSQIDKEIDRLEKEMLAEKYNTALKKAKFVIDIKSDLGQDIKKNPNKVKIIKKSFKEKVAIFLKKIFTKF